MKFDGNIENRCQRTDRYVLRVDWRLIVYELSLRNDVWRKKKDERRRKDAWRVCRLLSICWFCWLNRNSISSPTRFSWYQIRVRIAAGVSTQQQAQTTAAAKTTFLVFIDSFDIHSIPIEDIRSIENMMKLKHDDWKYVRRVWRLEKSAQAQDMKDMKAAAIWFSLEFDRIANKKNTKRGKQTENEFWVKKIYFSQFVLPWGKTRKSYVWTGSSDDWTDTISLSCSSWREENEHRNRPKCFG